MREIKFRAWFSMYQNKGPAMVYEGDVANLYFGQNLQGKDENDYVLMQYTGLKDKNGKEIYEGDWLEFIQEHEKGCDCEHCWPCRVGEIVGIKWVNDGWELLPPDQYMNGEEGRETYCEECSSRGGLYSPNHEIPVGCYAKIIGNIYENLELLNVTP